MEQTESVSSSSKIIFVFLWLISLLLASFFSYQIGKNSASPVDSTLSNAAPSTSPQTILGTSQTNITPTPTVDLSGICKKSGVLQKSEYLPSYIVQAGDSLQSIAEKELGDKTRVSELTTLNSGASNLTVGSTLYLPPSEIKKSSGNLAQLSGMLVRRDNAVWQISYGGGIKGLGVAIPAYYFSEVSHKDGFVVGDCVTIFMDDGVKVYTVTKQ